MICIRISSKSTRSSSSKVRGGDYCPYLHFDSQTIADHTNDTTSVFIKDSRYVPHSGRFVTRSTYVSSAPQILGTKLDSANIILHASKTAHMTNSLISALLTSVHVKHHKKLLQGVQKMPQSANIDIEVYRKILSGLKIGQNRIFVFGHAMVSF